VGFPPPDNCYVARELAEVRGEQSDRRPRRRRLRTAAIAVVLTALAAGAGVAVAETVRAGNLIIKVGGAESPTKLPKKKLAPITLKVKSDIATADHTQPPALQKIVLEFDRNGTLDTKGLPRCQLSKLENTVTSAAKHACKKALVGNGKTEARIALPGQAPFIARGPLLAFNGEPSHGHPVILMHVFAHVPAPTTFVVPGVITNAKGKYGKRVTIKIPKIAGGFGSLTHFNLAVHKTWKVNGKKHSYASARCANGVFLAHGTYSFKGGTAVSGGIFRTCKAK
jgi:hypothetical protein